MSGMLRTRDVVKLSIDSDNLASDWSECGKVDPGFDPFLSFFIDVDVSTELQWQEAKTLITFQNFEVVFKIRKLEGEGAHEIW